MKRLLNRIFKFLEVEDKKQSGINRLFFILIISWMGIGLVLNMSGQLWYYFVTLPSYQKSSFLQTETGLIAELAKQGIGYLVAGIVILGLIAVWRQGIKERQEMDKERKEMYSVLRTLELPLKELVVLVESLTARR